MIRTLLAIIAVAVVGAPAGGQEVHVPDYQSQHAEALLHSRLTGRMIRQAQERRRYAATTRTGVAGTTTASRARATCRDKKRIGAKLGPVKAARLSSLCAQAGY